MANGSGEYREYAHKISILGGGLMSLFAFLSLFGLDLSFGESKFLLNLIMVIIGLFILGIELDSDYIPTTYKIPFKSIRIKSFSYLVIGILLLGSGLPSILLISAAILYFI